MIQGYAIPNATILGNNGAYKSEFYKALEGAKAAGATVEEAPCLLARGVEAYNDGLPSTPSLLIVPQFYKDGNLYQDVPPFVAEDSTMRFTVSRNTTATRVNSSGLIASVASGVPRIDWLGQSCPALLVEASGSNQIRNNSMVGAVTGSPGTLPTNWSNQLGSGITQTIVGTGTENGVSYIDIRFSGTQIGATPTDIRFESATQIVASNSQTWNESVWLKIVAAPNPPTDYRLYMFERDSGGIFIKSATQVASLTTTLTRFSFTRTLDGGATVARVQPAITFTVANGITYDFTIRIGYPQMEQSPFATSVIPTTTAAVSRAADVISASGALVSSLIGQTEGTIYAEVDLTSFKTSPFLTISDGTDTNRIQLSFLSNTVLLATIRVGGVNHNYSATIPAIPSSGGVYKVTLGYAANNYCFALNGVIYSSTATRPVPACSVIGVGTSATNNAFLNDRIRAAALYTTRLSNDQLAELTRL